MNFIEATFQGLIVCRNYKRTWSFPMEVAELLQRETAGRSVLQLYGGMAEWGVRLDCDASVRPDIIGNALYPPPIVQQLRHGDCGSALQEYFQYAVSGFDSSELHRTRAGLVVSYPLHGSHCGIKTASLVDGSGVSARTSSRIDGIATRSASTGLHEPALAGQSRDGFVQLVARSAAAVTGPDMINLEIE